MTAKVSLKCLLMAAFLMMYALAGRAGNGLPGKHIHPIRHVVLLSLYDSLPDNKKVPEDPGNKSKPEIVKEVPKARKQLKPIVVPATTTTIKPMPLIKPKILKPNIRIH